MTIYKDQCRGVSQNDIDAVQFALKHGQAGGWGNVLDRLRGKYPKVEYYAGSTHILVLLDGTSNGRSVYVETLVHVVESDHAG